MMCWLCFTCVGHCGALDRPASWLGAVQLMYCGMLPNAEAWHVRTKFTQGPVCSMQACQSNPSLNLKESAMLYLCHLRLTGQVSATNLFYAVQQLAVPLLSLCCEGTMSCIALAITMLQHSMSPEPATLRSKYLTRELGLGSSCMRVSHGDCTAAVTCCVRRCAALARA